MEIRTPAEMDEADRQFLYRLRKNHSKAIRKHPDSLTYELLNNARGIYVAKKIKERFGRDASIRAIYRLDLEDLPEDVVELGKFSENVEANIESEF